MKIREVAGYDEQTYNAVVKLLPQLGTGIKVPSKQGLEDILKSGTHIFILEAENNEIAGLLALCVCKVPSGTKALVEDVVVDETQRGKGFGEALLKHAIGFSRSIGAESVELTSRPSRIAANRLYRKLGFALRETNVYKYTI
jgi:ribosomal protein S18 acetylase RimI-like enzyme